MEQTDSNKPKKITFIDVLYSDWCILYPQYRDGEIFEEITDGKSKRHIGILLSWYKKKKKELGENPTTEQTRIELNKVFVQCLSIRREADPWLYDNITLALIVSQWPRFKTIIKNGNRNKKEGTTRSELDEILKKALSRRR